MKSLFCSLICVVSLLTPVSSLLGQVVSYSYGSNGLRSISFNGTQYLSSGTIGVNAVNFQTAGGALVPGSTAGVASYDPANARTTLTFNWGTISTAYAASGGKFAFNITIQNSSSQTLQSLSLDPLALQFPATPAEFDGRDPIWAMNDGNPTAIRMTTSGNAVVLANEDVTVPLLSGFPGPVNGPANTLFPIRTETTGDRLVPSFVPQINRPIAPGGTDVWRMSLRFGTASTPTTTLVADVYQSFIKARPYRLNWPDRRGIGQLVIGTSAAGYPNNPRGWFLDRYLDVTTPQGVAAFQTRLLKWAADSVTVLKNMNAQGMVTWDIEGEQYPQATTYIGDPSQIATLAPEMAGVVDRYFKTFTDAGLRVGVCLRPQQLTFPAGGGAPTQVEVADPTQLLLNKLEYAERRWGATLFYIDSNGDPNYPMSPRFFETVARLHPEVLLMTEHQNDAYYAFSTPYDELKGGVTGTPQSVLDVYPSAASVIYVPDGAIAQNASALRAAVMRGDILMFRGWYPDPQNQQILGLYPANGAAPPVPTITSPHNADRIAGIVNVTASVAAPNGPAAVQYIIDGAPPTSSIAAAPYPYSFNSAQLPPGQHTIEAVARDTAGNAGFTTINVSTDVPAADPPTVSIAAPVSGAVVAGKVTVTATASSGSPIASVQLFVDGIGIGALTSPGYQYVWDTAGTANGAHTLSVVVTTSTGTTAQAAVSVTVRNLPPAPTVTFTSPANGSVLSGTTSVVVAPVGSGVLSAQIFLDGGLLANLNSALYSLSWNTRLAANGAHVLKASVTDASGSTGSATIAITVQNVSTPPSVSFLSPATGATVTGRVTVAVSASGVYPLASVQFGVDGSAAASLSGTPYQFSWDTTRLANGPHTLTVTAVDSAGSSTTATLPTTVYNAPAPPTISFTAPANGSVVSGSANVSLAAGGTGALSVRISVDGSSLATLTATPYLFIWNTLVSPNGSHTLSAVAVDSAGQTASASITVTVQNVSTPDTVRPSIQLTAPQNNATVSGVMNLSAAATDNVAVAKVAFTVDGVSVGESVAAPYAVQVSSTGLSGGLHYAGAAASDPSGNSATSTNSFSVSNSQPPACGDSGIRAFVACFYADAALRTPIATRLDTELNFDWGTGSPAAGVPASSFAATWLGAFNFDGGTYLFNIVANGGYRLYVDGQVAQDFWAQTDFSNRQIAQPVAPGTHSIRIQYRNGTGNEMKLSWSRQ